MTSMTAAELMTTLGFERLGPDPSQGDVILWMRSYGVQDLLVSLLATAPADDVALAIYEAGCRDKQAEVCGRWKAFTDSVRTPFISDTWAHARELQRLNREAMTAAGSAPKAQPPTVKL